MAEQTPSSNVTNATFIDANKHVPRILRQQLMSNLTSQFLSDSQFDDIAPKSVKVDISNSEKDQILTDYERDQIQTDEKISDSLKPSLERFYGALLFVDISGFTGLAQKLPPEELKTHINEYFTKMLTLINNFGGDVVKFAGDALVSFLDFSV